jgi:hypothetical protein
MFSLTVVLLATAAVWLGSSPTAGAEEYAGKTWPATDWVSIERIDHDAFDRLLKKYVDKNGMVNYKAWHASAADRATLKSYLEFLSRADLKRPASREAKLAFWINAYNALTLEGILRVYPTTSIRNHTAKLVGYNIWKNLLLHVGGQKVSLDHIEHQILRPMNEPRIHFAVVCASIGCPRLLNEAYVADRLEDQLVTNSTDFFARSQNFQVDGQGNLKLSQILKWYGGDFGNSSQDQIRAITPYFPQAARDHVAKGRYTIKYLKYDWNLNAQN